MAKNNNPGFVLLNEWGEDLDLLTMDERGELLTMLFEYANGKEDGIVATANKSVMIVFRSWRRFLDANAERREKVCRQNAENGRKGGAPRGNRNAAKNPVEQNLENLESVQQESEPLEPTTENNRTVELSSETSLSKSKSNSNSKSKSNSSVTASSNNATSPDPDPAPEMIGVSTGLTQIVRYYQDKISPDISRPTAEQLKQAAQEWPVEVVLAAIDSALDAGKRNGSYVCGILRGYRKDGIRTLADVQRKQEAFRAERDLAQVGRRAWQARQVPAGASGLLPADDLAHLFPGGDDG